MWLALKKSWSWFQHWPSHDVMLDQIKTICNGLMQLCYVLANRISVIRFFDFDGQKNYLIKFMKC